MPCEQLSAERRTATQEAKKLEGKSDTSSHHPLYQGLVLESTLSWRQEGEELAAFLPGQLHLLGNGPDVGEALI
jgi:hypothetical protein